MKSRIRRVGVTSKSVFYAVVIHVMAGVLLILNIEWPTSVVSSRPQPAPVQANVVSEEEIQKQMQALRQKEEAEEQKQLEAQKKLEQLLQQKKQEEQRLAEIKERQEEESRRAEELEKKKQQEKEQLAKLKQQEEEQRKKEEAERKRKEEAARQAEAERKEEEERKRREAEEKRRQQELAAKRERERQLQEQLERERLQRRVNSALAQYIPIIKQKVSRNWNRPASLRNNIEAHVTVRLSQAGEVISARVVKSSGNPVFDRSVENAVLKASPLPIPQERGVNEEFRNLKLIFKPEEMFS